MHLSTQCSFDRDERAAANAQRMCAEKLLDEIEAIAIAIAAEEQAQMRLVLAHLRNTGTAEETALRVLGNAYPNPGLRQIKSRRWPCAL